MMSRADGEVQSAARVADGEAYEAEDGIDGVGSVSGGSRDDRTTRTRRPPAGIRHLGLIAMGLFFLGTALPVHSSFGGAAHSLYSDNRTTNAMIVLLTVLPLIGLLGAGGWTRFGWAMGSLSITSAWSVGVIALSVGDHGRLAGLYLLAAAAACGFLAVGKGVLAQLSLDRTPRIPGGQWWLGAAGSVIVTLGLMLPPKPGTGSFIVRNFRTGDPLVTLAWLALACSFGAVGVIAFRSRSWWGLGAVSATMIPVMWVLVVYKLGLDSLTEPGSLMVKTDAVHKLVVVGVAAQSLAIAIAVVAAVGSRYQHHP